MLHHGEDWTKARQYLEFLGDVDLPASGVAYSIYYAELVSCEFYWSLPPSTLEGKQRSLVVERKELSHVCPLINVSVYEDLSVANKTMAKKVQAQLKDAYSVRKESWGDHSYWNERTVMYG